MRQIPQKKFYKIGELCRFTDTQPYVLKFWESEFPQLKPEKGPKGQAVYGKQAVDLILKIKQMLDEDDQTITAVRELLDSENGGGAQIPASRTNTATQAPRLAAVDEVDVSEPDSVSRSRYDNAVEEIADLRIELRQAEKDLRKMETSLASAESGEQACRTRADKAMALIKSLIDQLTHS
jgi:DNA-binding transcriptional MerR regulator